MIDFGLDNEKLLPVVTQDFTTKEVLILSFANKQAFEETRKSGYATYWSRSRNELWVKGKTSGNLQLVKEIRIDCDNDTVLLKIEQIGGAACHTGHPSCFYQKVTDDNNGITIIGEPVFDPKEVYKDE